jgi:hypothetical protein
MTLLSSYARCQSIESYRRKEKPLGGAFIRKTPRKAGVMQIFKQP